MFVTNGRMPTSPPSGPPLCGRVLVQDGEAWVRLMGNSGRCRHSNTRRAGMWSRLGGTSAQKNDSLNKNIGVGAVGLTGFSSMEKPKSV